MKPHISLIVIDDFYTNPHETRNFILTQDFSVRGNFPGQRTQSFATPDLYNMIQRIIGPLAGKITKFDIPGDPAAPSVIYNGAFQYTTSRDRSWIHNDGHNNWAGIVYLTPDAPHSSGTAFYKYIPDQTMTKIEMDEIGNEKEIDRDSQDMTKWELVDRIGNVFNRLILFDSTRFHMSMDYFGHSKETGRLFQTFFFSTEMKEENK